MCFDFGIKKPVDFRTAHFKLLKIKGLNSYKLINHEKSKWERHQNNRRK